ncbi:MAG: hypothetical protein ABIY55_14705 [Kofleriaceae bacterium]
MLAWRCDLAGADGISRGAAAGSRCGNDSRDEALDGEAMREGHDAFLRGGRQAVPGVADGEAEIDGDIERDLGGEDGCISTDLGARAGEAGGVDHAVGPQT